LAHSAPGSEGAPARAAVNSTGALPAAERDAADPYEEVRGMTISCPGAGESWASEAMVETLGVLKNLGVNWVAIHPYGGIENDGTVGRSGIDRMYANPIWLTRAIEEAHAKGLRIMIKPHLAYWGSRFSWCGAISFEDEASWRRFFDTYTAWITRVARLSGGADAFVVGNELDQTTRFEASWRDIIAAVREELSSTLTYSARWDTYESVPFWDALDVIAIQAYFPLVDHENEPTATEVEKAWSDIIFKLDAYGARTGRKVVLSELGYNRALTCAVRPWMYPQDSDPLAETIQLRCLDAALDAIDEKDRVMGAFLWKWFPGEIPRGNFRKSAPAVRAVIAAHWGLNRAAESSPRPRRVPR
jgi:hypothetical protein